MSTTAAQSDCAANHPSTTHEDPFTPVPLQNALPAVPEIPHQQVMVLGLGNILFQDEGLGVRAVERLQDEHILPEEVRVIDGGVRGLDLLPYFDGVSHLLILDAVQTSGTPGSLVRLEGQEVPSGFSISMSLHQIGVKDLLAAASFAGKLPKEIVLLGMQPESIDWSAHLTPTIERALPTLVRTARDQLTAWGVQIL